MGYIVTKNGFNVGDKIKLTKELKSIKGTFTEGSEVYIIGVGNRGYDIKDAEGNQMFECGWCIGVEVK